MNPNKIRDMQIRRLTRKLLREFKGDGIYLYHVSVFDSVYLKFKNNSIGSIRIGDHKGRKKYRYRFNIEINGKTRTEVDRNVTRYYFDHEDIEEFVGCVKHFIFELTVEQGLFNKLLRNMKIKELK